MKQPTIRGIFVNSHIQAVKKKKGEAGVRELKKLDQFRANLVSTVSHELRTPLSAIKAGIDLLVDEVDGPVNDSQRESLTIAKDNVDRLARLIDSILDFSRFEAGKMAVRFRRTDMTGLLRGVYDFLKHAVSKREIDFCPQLPPGPLYWVCDPDKIRQVLINLVDNAVKFTAKGGRITLRLMKPTRRRLAISVQDTGIGIPKKDQKTIFGMFRQADSRRLVMATGSGIGLAVCLRLMKLHQGEISVRSRLGKGSCFTLVIPSGLQETRNKETLIGKVVV